MLSTSSIVLSSVRARQRALAAAGPDAALAAVVVDELVGGDPEEPRAEARAGGVEAVEVAVRPLERRGGHVLGCLSCPGAAVRERVDASRVAAVQGSERAGITTRPRDQLAVVGRDLLERLCLLQPFRRTHGPLSPSQPADLTQCGHQPFIGRRCAILSAHGAPGETRPLPPTPDARGTLDLGQRVGPNGPRFRGLGRGGSEDRPARARDREHRVVTGRIRPGLSYPATGSTNQDFAGNLGHRGTLTPSSGRIPPLQPRVRHDRSRVEHRTW